MVSTRPAPSIPDEGSDWVATIRRVAGGDQGALGELYDGTSPIVLGLIRRIVVDSFAAEEITLDVYTQVWRLAGTYAREKGSPMTWLLMLARSRAIDHVRSRARRAKDLESPIETAFDHSHRDPNPETLAIAGSRRRIVQKVLADLTPEQLSVLQLAFYDGLSHIEIADKTGIPLGTVKSRIRSAMTRMRELLEPQVGVL